MMLRFALVAFLATASWAQAETVTGRASVIDGDTIEFSGERIRLNGIDAPESAQLCLDADGDAYRCGQAAALALDDWLAASRPTRCEFIEWDRYGRFVGQCFRADGAKVQDWLVRAGHILDWPRYSRDAYAAAQAEAQSGERGMWAGEFTLPWEWRRGERLEAETVALVEQQGAPSTDCIIKGNVNRDGDRIYHTPASRHYDRVQIDESAGQRWFCTKAEAEAAGWRAPRG